MAADVIRLRPPGTFEDDDVQYTFIDTKWEVDDNGHLRQICKNDLLKFVAVSAPIVTSMKEDISGSHPPECEVSFVTPAGERRTITVNPEVLFNPTKVGGALRELATCRHKELTEWFTDFFMRNGRRIPKTVTSATAGWVRDRHGNIVGRALPGRDSVSENDDEGSVRVGFHSPKRTVAARVDAYRPSQDGSLDVWLREVAQPICDRPVFATVMGAAVASVMLGKTPSAAPAFIVELAKATKAGKTMLTRVIQSFFGRSGGHGALSLERSWKLTKVAAADYLGACGGGLPVFFDDSAAEDESYVEGRGAGRYISPYWLAMNLANTGERLAGTADGEGQSSGVWSLLGFATTEADMLGGMAGGATNRVLHLDYRPSTIIKDGRVVDASQDEDAAYIKRVVAAWQASESCYGHGLDPLFDILEDVDVSAAVDTQRDVFEAAFKDFGFGVHYSRMCALVMAGVVAFNGLSEMEIGVRLLDEASVVTFLIDAVSRRLTSIGDIDPAERAWGDFITWAATVRGVYLWDGTNVNPPKQRCLGVWKQRAASDATDGATATDAAVKATGGALLDDLFISSPGMEVFCRETNQKLKPVALLNAWASKDRLVAQKSAEGGSTSERFKKTLKGYNGVSIACYAISGKAWRQT